MINRVFHMHGLLIVDKIPLFLYKTIKNEFKIKSSHFLLQWLKVLLLSFRITNFSRLSFRSDFTKAWMRSPHNNHYCLYIGRYFSDKKAAVHMKCCGILTIERKRCYIESVLINKRIACAYVQLHVIHSQQTVDNKFVYVVSISFLCLSLSPLYIKLNLNFIYFYHSVSHPLTLYLYLSVCLSSTFFGFLSAHWFFVKFFDTFFRFDLSFRDFWSFCSTQSLMF